MSSLPSVGDVVDVELTRPATGGAVGRVNGAVSFVRLGLPGERVRAQVTEVAKSYVRAVATDIVVASPDRVAPPCPYAVAFGCGGCDLQHATASAQLGWKSAVAEEHVRRIAGLNLPVVSQSLGDGQGTRTRVRCAVDDGRLGLRQWRSHDVTVLDDCWIADPRLAPAFQSDWTEASEVELRAIGSGTPFAVVTTDDGRIHLRDLDNRPLDGGGSVAQVHGAEFRISPRSFWQSHRDAPDVLTTRVLAHAQDVTAHHVVDLYGGVGLFGVALATQDDQRRVTVVEQSPDACADARHNGRTLTAFRVAQRAVTPTAISELVGDGDLVVMDPPRSGAGKGTIAALARARPARVIYVSCDAATLARDISGLLDNSYTLGVLEAYDLFPMTEHLELVAVLDAGSV